MGPAANVAEAAKLVDYLVSDEGAPCGLSGTVSSSAPKRGGDAHRQPRLGIAGVATTSGNGSELLDRLIETLGPMVRRFNAKAPA